MNICPICGSDFEDKCLRCIQELSRCILCYDQFLPNDKVIQCKSCRYMGHLKNFEIWLKERNECPACKISLEIDNFIRINAGKDIFERSFLDRSEIYSKRKLVFKDFNFRPPYYKFQETLLSIIISDFTEADSVLLVSPPGSGKTIIGLAVAKALSVNTLILTPNLAVLGSWLDRTQMFFDEENNKLNSNEIIGREQGILKPFTITTYHRINSELRNEGKRAPREFVKQTGLSDLNNHGIIEQFVEHDIGLVILDEAHRLSRTWGENIQNLLSKLNHVKVLGLTATPPEDRNSEFDSIFNQKRYEIPRPMLVREGILAPYSDLVLMLPSSKNTKFTQGSFSADRAEILWNKGLEEFESVKYYLNLGYTGNTEIEWLVKNSSWKALFTMEIIRREMEWMGEEIRTLVISDQENIPTKYDHDLKGNRGAIGIFEELVLDSKIDLLDPVFVTGKSLLIDDDFVNSFVQQGKKWATENGYEIEFRVKSARKKKYSIINGKGKDWNTETYTRYVTYLFELGTTKCLVGTRFLLGEGWDSLSLNTVIDLTTISAYSTVNQVKGRSLRKNPLYLDKVSNLWEIINYPLENELTSSDFESFRKRHHKYFGVDEDGNVRNGINRLNTMLSINPKKYDVEKFNSLTFHRAQKRSDLIKLWKVGEKLGSIHYVIKLLIPAEKKYRKYHNRIDLAITRVINEICRTRDLPLDWKVKVAYRNYASINSINGFEIKIYAPFSTQLEVIEQLIAELSSPDYSEGYAIQIHYLPYPKLVSKLLNKIFGIQLGTYQTLIFPSKSPLPVEDEGIDTISINLFKIKMGFITPHFQSVETSHLANVQFEYEYIDFGESNEGQFNFLDI